MELRKMVNDDPVHETTKDRYKEETSGLCGRR